MFATFTKLFAGSAFAAVLAVPQLASAGCGPSGACPATARPAAHAGIHHASAPGAAVAAPPASTQLPVAHGPGQVVQRYSYEPGTDVAGQGISAAPAYRAAPAFRSPAPRHRSSGMRSSGFNGNSAERRLNAGAGSHGYRR